MPPLLTGQPFQRSATHCCADTFAYSACWQNRKSVRRPGRPCWATTFTDQSGKTASFDQPVIKVGSKDADLSISGSNISPQHAEVRTGGGKTTCTALVGSEEDLFSDTYTWLDGNQLRTGVAYLLGPACKLAFGTADREYTIDFEQAKGGGGALEMLMRGMAAGAPKEVQDQLDG